MKSVLLFLCLSVAFGLGMNAAEPNKPKGDAPGKPQQKPKKSTDKKSEPAPKPQPSRRDLALKEVRAADHDKDRNIDGLEIMTLNNILKSNPDTFLYLFDENGNKSFDSTEIAAINKAIKPKKK
jgi:hypothetical protein